MTGGRIVAPAAGGIRRAAVDGVRLGLAGEDLVDHGCDLAGHETFERGQLRGRGKIAGQAILFALHGQVLRLVIVVLHSPQDRFVLQDEALAALGVGLADVFAGLEPDHIAAARHVERPGRLHGMAGLFLVLLQGKEIQEHLQILAVKQVGIGEILAAGLVVDDAEVGRTVLFVGIHAVDDLYALAAQNIHAVDLAGEQTVAAGGMVDDGRHLGAGGEGQLLRRGGELRQTQLARHIQHDGGSLLPVAGGEIALAAGAGVALREVGLHARVHAALGERRDLRVGEGGKAALRLGLAHDVLENVMDEGAEQRRVEFCLLPWRGAQAVLQEKRVPAAREPVDLRRGKRDRPAVERTHRLWPHGGEGIRAALR